MRLESDFEDDLGESREVNYEQWKRRSLRERMLEWSGWILRKQQ
ncbi:MAG: hypothetical protein ABI383_14375 [Acidobacteriaceae bacterium]